MHPSMPLATFLLTRNYGEEVVQACGWVSLNDIYGELTEFDIFYF